MISRWWPKGHLSYFRPVGKRISREHFSESMKLIWIAFIVLMLMGAVNGQQTSEDWFTKGNLLLNSGKYDESIEAYNKSIELNQEVAAAWKQKGNAFLNLTKYNESLKCYNKAIKLDPKYVAAWYNKGIALYDLGKYEEAIQAYDEAIRLEPNYAPAWNNKGQAICELYGGCDASFTVFEAEYCFDLADKIGQGSGLKNSSDWSNLGYNFFDREGGPMYEYASFCFDVAIKLDSKNGMAWGGKGDALYLMGNFTDAIKSYDAAIKLDQKNEYAWYNKANALRMLHRNSEAEAAYGKARELGYNEPMTQMELTAK